MQKEIRCPICGGNKYEKIRPNTFKCIYCHSIFTVEDEIETKNVQEQGHTTFEESNNKNKTSYVNTFNQENDVDAKISVFILWALIIVIIIIIVIS
jgi:hypothetical protein